MILTWDDAVFAVHSNWKSWLSLFAAQKHFGVSCVCGCGERQSNVIGVFSNRPNIYGQTVQLSRFHRDYPDFA